MPPGVEYVSSAYFIGRMLSASFAKPNALKAAYGYGYPAYGYGYPG